MTEYITSTQAAKLLGVTKRTILRWEEKKWLASERDDRGSRIYKEEYVCWAKRLSDEWEKVRIRHRNHLKKLPAIQREVQRFIVTKPLQWTDEPILHDLNEMQKSFDAMNKWKEEMDWINRMYDDFFHSNLISRAGSFSKMTSP